MKKWFTLIEVLIVTVILGILIAIILQSYVTMSRIAFGIQQQKAITEQLVYISQVLQNFADTTNIDYDAYALKFGTSYLIDNQGHTPVLLLTGQWGGIQLSAPSECSLTSIYASGTKHDCYIYLTQSGTTNPVKLNTTAITTLRFVIMPQAPAQTYLDTPLLCNTNFINCLRTPAFWVFATLVSPYTNNSQQLSIPIQQFYTFPAY